jgi:hypothetical protein
MQNKNRQFCKHIIFFVNMPILDVNLKKHIIRGEIDILPH